MRNEMFRIEELIVPARVADLNDALEKHGIAADAVVAILTLSGSRLAGGPGERFRVLYRAA